MDYKTITLTIDEGIANIVLNRPKALNAMSSTMMGELNAALDACSSDEKVRTVVFSGAGKGFCSGGDVKEMMTGLMSGDMDAAMDTFKKSLDESAEIVKKIRSIPKPVIASVHGSAAGAGFSLASACDFRIVADDAQFIQAFAKIGLIPDMGGLYFLTKSLGYAGATELCMSARPVKAQEALDLGLVNKVVPAADLEAETKKFADQYAKGAGVSYGKIKDMVNKIEMTDLEAHLNEVTKNQLECAQTQDFGEGVMSFVEKRAPKFKGK